MTNEKDESFCLADLRQFTGTEQWYRHRVARNVLYTDGVKFLAEKAGAYWLIDEIALVQPFKPKLRQAEFQTWELTIRKDSSASLVATDGNGNVLYRKRIPWTDFPESGLKLYVEGPLSQRTILVPSEH